MGIPAPIGVSSQGLPPKRDQANAVISGVITAVGPQKPFAFRGPMNALLWASINTALTTVAGSLSATVASATGLAVGNAINSVNVPKGAVIGALVGTTATIKLPPVTYPVTGFSLLNGIVTLPPGSNVNGLLGATVAVPSNAEDVTIAAGTTVTTIVQADIAPTADSPGLPGIIQLSSTPTAIPPASTPQPLEFGPGATAITVAGADTAASFTGAAITYSATLNLERSFDGGATWLLANIGGGGQLAQYSIGTPISLTFGEPEKNVLYRWNCVAYTSGTINYRISETGGAAESLAIGPLI